MRTFNNTKMSTIHAIECRKVNMDILREADLDGVILHDAALVGQNNGNWIDFESIISEDDQYCEWGNVMKLNRIKNIRKASASHEIYSVPTIKINDIFKKLNIDNIDYLKMDIEGAEGEVIETMSEETASKIKQISLERHDNVIYEDIASCMERLGYELAGDKNEIYGVHI